MLLLSISGRCIHVIDTSLGMDNPQVPISISSHLCEQASIEASSTVYKRSTYTSYFLWFVIGKTTISTTALPVAGSSMRNGDLAQDALHNSLSPALLTEVSPAVTKSNLFPKKDSKSHCQSHFAGGLNALMENYLATWLGEK